MSLISSLHVASTALHAQSLRLNTVASNMANADSTVDTYGRPYRSKQVVFRSVPMEDIGADGVEVMSIVESEAPGRRTYEPEHPQADAQGFVTYPNVNAIEEMVNMISASRSYQMNLEAMNAARELMQRSLDILGT
ncbi:MAG: flagellar basal body rod protein FlgC [Betaproteobacteria bacterium]|jgi:flagellar basal-body rod protein FlgC|nr:flagellar basal body rod protein FlgC [Betaproteobacteria bacterium]